MAVATTGSVRAAAEELVVSQPAVSAAVSGLQAELRLRLVEPDGRGLRLTAAGAVLAEYSRRLLGLWEEATVAASAAADPEHGRLRLAAVTTAGEHVVPALLASFRQRHPSVELSLEVGNRRWLWDALRHGGADLGIGGRPPTDGRLATQAEADNELVVVSAPGAGEGPGVREVSVATLASSTWLVREPGSGTRSTAEEFFAQMSIDPPRLTLGSNGSIRESATVELGIALISRAAVARELGSGALVEWRSGPLPLRRSWHLVARVGQMLPATAVMFCHHVLHGATGWQPTPGRGPGAVV